VVYITRGQSSFSVVELKPNPTKDRFDLSFEIEKDQMVNIDLLDGTGKVLRSDEYKAKLGINNINFDLSNYVKGLYTVRITSEGESIVRKVVKD
jgi:hypothetical protein